MSSFEEHRDYIEAGLPDGALGPDPLIALQEWLTDAEEAGLPDPNAMVVGTVAREGRRCTRKLPCTGVGESALEK